MGIVIPMDPHRHEKGEELRPVEFDPTSAEYLAALADMFIIRRRFQEELEAAIKMGIMLGQGILVTVDRSRLEWKAVGHPVYRASQWTVSLSDQVPAKQIALRERG